MQGRARIQGRVKTQGRVKDARVGEDASVSENTRAGDEGVLIHPVHYSQRFTMDMPVVVEVVMRL